MYYSVFNLKKEPFTNTPDPNFLYESKTHKYCLQQLELSIRLKRGLSVVLGHVGTGKTTLCRRLLNLFYEEKDYIFYLILDPDFDNERDFLKNIYTLFYSKTPPNSFSNKELKEHIKNSILEFAHKQQVPILLIDEGQKLRPCILECIREFLNFETNENKLLQVIIFAQEEFFLTIKRMPNFFDRIHIILKLRPLYLWEVKNFLIFRLRAAGADIFTSKELFSWPAIFTLYKASKGFPRKLVHIAHKSLLQAAISSEPKVKRKQVKTVLKREKIATPNRKNKFFVYLIIALFITLACILIMWKSSSINYFKIGKNIFHKYIIPTQKTSPSIPITNFKGLENEN